MKPAVRWTSLTAVCLLALAVGASGAQAQDASSGMAPVFASPNQASNSDLAFWGDHAFVGYHTGAAGFPAGTGPRGGVRIFDLSNPAAPVLVRDLACDGAPNDPIVWDRNGNGIADLMVLGVDTTMAAPQCGSARVASGASTGWEGVRVFTMSDDPAAPFATITQVAAVYTDCGAHAITAWPAEIEDTGRLLVYVSSFPRSAGPTCGDTEFLNTANPYDEDPGAPANSLHGVVQVLEVPLSNPAAANELDVQPRITYPGDPDGRMEWCERASCGGVEPAALACHDITVHVGLGLAGAGCLEQGQVWEIGADGIPDTADPVTVLDDAVSSGGRGTIPGAVDLFASVRLSDDGHVLSATDESLGTGCPTVTTWQPRPWNPSGGTHETGRLLLTAADGAFRSAFHVGDLRPNAGTTEHCSAGLGAVVPGTGRDLLVNAWHTGGVDVIDFSDPASPQEIAFFDPARDSGTFAAYPYTGPLFPTGTGIPVYASDGATDNASAQGLVVYRTATGDTPRRTQDHLNPQTYDPRSDPCEGSVGCWHFDEAPGATTAADSSGNDNDGTYVNGPLLGVPGVSNTAVAMDGVNDHVRVPDDPTLDTGDSFTLTGWVKRDDDGRSHQLFNKGGRSYQLVVMSRFEGNQVWLRKAGSSTIVRSDGGVPADGAWHQVVATKDGPNSAQLYIDGVPQTEQVVSGVQVIEDTAFPLYLSSTPSGNVVRGELDEFAVLDEARSAGEVAAGYDPPDATPARRAVQPSTTAAGGGCGRAGTASSGITGLRVEGVPCAVATEAAFAGPEAVRALGFKCEVTDEDFSTSVTRITHECTGPLGRQLRYVSLS